MQLKIEDEEPLVEKFEMNILEGDAFEVKEAMKNEVEVWRWSIKLDFEVKEMVKTSEVDKVMLKKSGSNEGWSW